MEAPRGRREIVRGIVGAKRQVGAVEKIDRVEGREKRVVPTSRVPGVVGDGKARVEPVEQSLAVLAEGKGVAGAVGDGGDSRR